MNTLKRLALGAAAHLSVNVALQAALDKPAGQAALKITDVAQPGLKLPRAKLAGHQAHKPSGSQPVPGGGNRERARALAKMAKAAAKRQDAREAARAAAAAGQDES